MQDPTTIHLLDMAIKSLRRDIAPTVGDDHTRIRFDQITRLLYQAMARLTKREDGLQLLLQQARDDDSLPTPEATTGSLEELENYRREVEGRLIQSIPELLESADGREDELAALESIVQLEKNFYLSQDPDIAAGSQVVYRGGRIDSEKPVGPAVAKSLDAGSLTDYLRKRFGRDTVRASDLRVIPGGFSKETIFFTLEDAAEQTSQDLVIRKDMPVPFIEKTVSNEFGLLAQLHSKGFPVAEPLWLEEDYSVFSGKFIVSRRVPGTSDVSVWAADRAVAIETCYQLAELLATLHGFEPEELGLPGEVAAMSAGQLMEREIATWEALFRKKKQEPLPLQELPLQWLKRNIPGELYKRAAKVVHGDFGFHNLMVGDTGRVTAILDWEFSVLGDPTQDLCFLRPFVESIMSWQDFLDRYISSGGAQPCQEVEFFFSLWSKVRNSIGCVDAQSIFDKQMPDELKFALAGHVFAPYLYIDECESLLSHMKSGSA